MNVLNSYRAISGVNVEFKTSVSDISLSIIRVDVMNDYVTDIWDDCYYIPSM
jgi:hypothetical protein